MNEGSCAFPYAVMQVIEKNKSKSGNEITIEEALDILALSGMIKLPSGAEFSSAIVPLQGND